MLDKDKEGKIIAARDKQNCLQSLSLKCDPQSSMSRSPTSISMTFNQTIEMEKWQ